MIRWVLAGFLFSLNTQAQIPAGYESYQERPDILQIKPQAHPELPDFWHKLKRGHVESAVQISELHRTRHRFYLARDSELLYDMDRLITRNDPESAGRLHLLNISRANMRADNVKAYLFQRGISDLMFKNGREAVFADTGFAGTIPRTIAQFFPEHSHQMFTHLLSSANPKLPSSRVFLSSINPEAPRLDPGSLHASIIDYEHMPRSTNRSSQFAVVKGSWAAIAETGKSEDGSVSKDMARKFQEDLAAYFHLPETQALIKERQAQYRSILTSLEKGDKQATVALLKKILQTNPDDPFAESLVRDVIDVHEKVLPPKQSLPQLLTVEDVDLPAIQGDTRNNKEYLAKKYPAWKPILENPSHGIQKLLDTQDYTTLGAISDSLNDDEFSRLLLEKIGRKSPIPSGHKKFLRTFIESDNDWLLQEVARRTFSQKTAIMEMKEEFKLLLERGGQYVRNAMVDGVFGQDHSAQLREEMRLFIQKADYINLLNLLPILGQQNMQHMDEERRTVMMRLLTDRDPTPSISSISQKCPKGDHSRSGDWNSFLEALQKAPEQRTPYLAEYFKKNPLPSACSASIAASLQ